MCLSVLNTYLFVQLVKGLSCVCREVQRAFINYGSSVGFGSAACRFGSCLNANKLWGNDVKCCIAHQMRLVEKFVNKCVLIPVFEPSRSVKSCPVFPDSHSD